MTTINIIKGILLVIGDAQLFVILWRLYKLHKCKESDTQDYIAAVFTPMAIIAAVVVVLIIIAII